MKKFRIVWANVMAVSAGNQPAPSAISSISAMATLNVDVMAVGTFITAEIRSISGSL
jgi:hypothetical protein